MVAFQKGSNIHGQETESVRQNIDIQSLSAKLLEELPFLKSPLQVKQFKLGQSNPTFLVIGQNSKIVIRKQPAGSLISTTAHRVDREFLVLDCLKKHSSVPVPKVYFYCDDPSVTGTRFYAMEYLEGRIFADNLLPTVPLEDKKDYYYEMVKTLSKLHSVPFEEIGLKEYGKQGRFYQRQITSLSRISQLQSKVKGSGPDSSEVGQLYEFDEILTWFKNNAVEDRVTLVHGDYKTDNIVFHAHSNQIIGILDWELSTIGHPLSDLANLLLPWYIPVSTSSEISGFFGAKRPLQVPEADELIKMYCDLQGIQYPIKNWNFCIAFAFFRLSVITQGIAARLKTGQASSGFAAKTAALFNPVSMLAYSIAKGGIKDPALTDKASKL